MGLIGNAIREGNRKKRELTHDESGWIAIAAVAILAVASLIGTYYITKPIGEGVGDAFTIFGGQISLYVVAGVVILGMIFLWLVFGKKD